MNIYLSYGAGVGSEALRLWLLENNWPHEAVYVDHGCDWPETQEFVKTVPNLTVIKPNYLGYDNLYQYCVDYKTVPVRYPRWCTYQFKVQPFLDYIKKPAIYYIGYTIEESRRIKPFKEKQEGITKHYPLVCANMTRKDCIEYIKSKNMPVPMRSGCWFCPNQRKGQWKLLRKKHPDLYQKAKELETLNMEYRESKGKPGLTISRSRVKLEDITQERQGELFSF